MCFDSLQTTCFNNGDVEQAVAVALQRAGVEVHSGFLLAHYNDSQGGDEVFSAAFTSNTKPIRLECAAVFAFYQQMVDYDAFKGQCSHHHVFRGQAHGFQLVTTRVSCCNV